MVFSACAEVNPTLLQRRQVFSTRVEVIPCRSRSAGKCSWSSPTRGGQPTRFNSEPWSPSSSPYVRRLPRQPDFNSRSTVFFSVCMEVLPCSLDTRQRSGWRWTFSAEAEVARDTPAATVRAHGFSARAEVNPFKKAALADPDEVFSARAEINRRVRPHGSPYRSILRLAEVIPSWPTGWGAMSDLLRRSGGPPGPKRSLHGACQCSPHAGGNPALSGKKEAVPHVFSACAEVNRRGPVVRLMGGRFLRPRGGHPTE